MMYIIKLKVVPTARTGLGATLSMLASLHGSSPDNRLCESISPSLPVQTSGVSCLILSGLLKNVSFPLFCF